MATYDLHFYGPLITELEPELAEAGADFVAVLYVWRRFLRSVPRNYPPALQEADDHRA
jgi:hypothetical protein